LIQTSCQSYVDIKKPYNITIFAANHSCLRNKRRNTNYKTIILKDKHVNNYIAMIQSKGKASMEDGPMKRRKGR